MSALFPNILQGASLARTDYLSGTIPGIPPSGLPLSYCCWYYRLRDTANNDEHFFAWVDASSSLSDDGISGRIRGSSAGDPYRFGTRDTSGAQNAQLAWTGLPQCEWNFVGGTWTANNSRTAIINKVRNSASPNQTGTKPGPDTIYIGADTFLASPCYVSNLAVFNFDLTTAIAEGLFDSTDYMQFQPWEYFPLSGPDPLRGRVRGTMLERHGNVEFTDFEPKPFQRPPRQFVVPVAPPPGGAAPLHTLALTGVGI